MRWVTPLRIISLHSYNSSPPPPPLYPDTLSSIPERMCGFYLLPFVHLNITLHPHTHSSPCQKEVVAITKRPYTPIKLNTRYWPLFWSFINTFIYSSIDHIYFYLFLLFSCSFHCIKEKKKFHPYTLNPLLAKDFSVYDRRE